MIRIKVYDKEYPYLPTMGASIAFKQDTGIEPTDVGDDTELNVKYAYHVVRAASRRTGEEPMTLSFEEFCLGLSSNEYYRVVAESMKETAAELGIAKEGDDGAKK